jgi:Pregnancy-associated plasma protein-A/Secretion system C-terminal sorting domain
MSMNPSKSHFFYLRALFVFFVLFISRDITAQVRCGSVEYDKMLHSLHPLHEDSAQFERWMKSKINQLKTKALQEGRVEDMSYTIPVVVHVIHNGEPIGTGINIDSAQIARQIEVINQDYPRLNADTTLTPAEFKPVAGKINITFVLAKQDPEGLPTNGITRVKGTKTGWTLEDNATFKALSYWPANNYLNLWVIKFVDPSGIIGFAQLPVSSLPGLEDASNDSLTDGVAIDYRAFGTDNPELYSAFNIGRTATHEIGHILGMRHTWGDVESCSGTDYVSDTPPQLGSTSGCPTGSVVSCTVDKMYQNYMDYTDDPCMNMFTQGQIDRMVVVLANSPRRLSLLTSPGATAPTLVPNDLGIKRIASPGPGSCPTALPGIVIRNYGTNPITATQIQFSLNGTPVETKSFSLNLVPLDSLPVSFSGVTLPFGSTNKFSFQILSTNGGSDGKPSNNALNLTVTVPAQTTLPLYEPFNTTPANWQIVNPDNLITWQNVVANNGTASNNAMFMDFYDYQNPGDNDWLISPVFDLTGDTAAVLRFDWAYATTSNTDEDQLRVLVSTSCDFSDPAVLFNESGSTLATVSSTSNFYSPRGAGDWKTQTISLVPFLGKSNVQIAFVGTNDYGNNLYLDNVRIITGNYTDLTLAAVKSPSPVTCEANPSPVVTVKNNGSTLVTSLDISSVINSTTTTVNSFSGFQLDTGEQMDFDLSSWGLSSGSNEVVVSVQNPNGVDDVSPTDNIKDLTEIVDNSSDIIPLRQNFDSNFPGWNIASEKQQMQWVSTATNKSISIEYNAFSNLSIGQKSWLVSPVLDFSKAEKASVFFDVSYSKSLSGDDRLQILFSKDCGQTFPSIVFDEPGSQFNSASSSSAWTPQVDADWKRLSVNLDTLVGNKKSRVAFVVTNDHGNNMFLDNIEFYINDDENPLAITSNYLVYDNYLPQFKITFNLPNKTGVHLQVYSTTGQKVIDNNLEDVLNQTYTIDMTGQQAGMYIVKLQIGAVISASKVIVPY